MLDDTKILNTGFVEDALTLFKFLDKIVDETGEENVVHVGTLCISGRFLQDEILTIKTAGCSILAYSWKYAHNRVLIDILVSCPHSLHFVSSVDATEFVEDALTLFKFLDKIVDETGEENVVQVGTQNTPGYQAARKMPEEKRKNLFWTHCAASCIEEILEDFVKIKWVAECIEKAQKLQSLCTTRCGYQI